MVNRALPFLIGLAALFLQMMLSDFLTIRGLRPDFVLIFVVYLSIRWGGLAGIIAGFSLGLMEDFLSAGSLMGLAPLTKSITGFLVGRLQGRYNRMSPITFHAAWVGIMMVHFFIFIYVNYQSIYATNPGIFLQTYIFATVYTFIFIVILQAIMPLSKVKTLPK